MHQRILEIDVKHADSKGIMNRLINFWLHDFLLRIGELDLDNDNIYTMAIWLKNFKQRINKNKKVVQITSVYQLLVLLLVVNDFVVCNLHQSTGQVNPKFVQSISQLQAIISFGNLLIRIEKEQNNKGNKISDKQRKNYAQICSAIHNTHEKSEQYFQAKCNTFV